VRLFERVGRRLLLAPAGERLLRSARAVLDELERAEEEVGRNGTARSLIRLTTQCNTVYHWLPPLLRRFQRPHPEVDLEVVAGATSDPIPALVSGAIDLAIVFRPVREPRVCLRALFRDEMVVVLPPRHRLCRVPFVSAQDLGPEHLILYSIPPEANLVFRDVLLPAGVRPKRVTHIQLTEAIVEMVKADLAVSVLPRWSVAPQLERGELVARSLTRAGRFRSWSAAWRRRDPAPALLDFVELLARHPLPLGRTAGERRRIAAALEGGARRAG
jgi:LysR family transcriptional regulator for metE and metH